MSAKVQITGVSSLLSSLFNRKREERRKRKSLATRGRRTLQMEGLEQREMFAISTIGVYGGALQMWTDNNATSVSVGQVGSYYRVTEAGTNRIWDYAASSIGRVDFIGGAGNDRFVNYISTMNTRAWGQGGNDYLEGFNGVDEFYGGENNDTLVGYGGNDVLRGGNGNDIIKGMAGVDYLYGEGGDDYIEGGSEDDRMWGGENDDTLLGGTGNDQMVGDNGNDQLNGQAGIDSMWGTAGNDVLISIDGAFNEYVDGGNDSDTLWIDGISSIFLNVSDTTPGLSSLDTVQKVSSFANGADLSLDGDNINDPTDVGTKVRFINNITVDNIRGNNPLFSTGGPSSADVFQGGLGDCWLMAPLGTIANKNQNIVRQNIVDFNDGTFGVRLGNSFYRVDNELPIANAASGAASSNLRFARLGTQNSMWAAIVEKAFTHYRGGNSYTSIVAGSETEVYSAFRLKNVSSGSLGSYIHPLLMGAEMLSKWNAGYALSISPIATITGAFHAFGVERLITNSTGTVTDIVLRNPWGTDRLERFSAFASANGGASSTDGLFTVSLNQLFSSGGSLRWGQV